MDKYEDFYGVDKYEDFYESHTIFRHIEIVVLFLYVDGNSGKGFCDSENHLNLQKTSNSN